MNPPGPALVEHSKDLEPTAQTERNRNDEERQQIPGQRLEKVAQPHWNQTAARLFCEAFLQRIKQGCRGDECDDSEEIVEQIVRRIVPGVDAFEMTPEVLIPQFEDLVPATIGESDRGRQKGKQPARQLDTQSPRSGSNQPERRNR